MITKNNEKYKCILPQKEPQQEVNENLSYY